MATASVTYTFAPNTLIESAEMNTNLSDLVTFLNSSAMHRDASGAFTAVPSGPSADPVSANQLTRKSYVDGVFAYVGYSGDTSSGTSSNVFNSLTDAGSNGVTVDVDKLTILTTGLYEVRVSAVFTSNADGTRRNVAARSGGSVVVSGNAGAFDMAISSGFGLGVGGVSHTSMSASDEVTFTYNQDSGVLLDVTFAASIRLVRL